LARRSAGKTSFWAITGKIGENEAENLYHELVDPVRAVRATGLCKPIFKTGPSLDLVFAYGLLVREVCHVIGLDYAI